MADIGGVAGSIAEALVDPVQDEVGQALEAGSQALFGSTPAAQDPAVKQQREAEEQKKIEEQRWIIQKNDKLDKELSAVRQQNEQKEQARNQTVQQEEKVQQFRVVERDQQREAMAKQVQDAKIRSETRKGVGG